MAKKVVNLTYDQRNLNYRVASTTGCITVQTNLDGMLYDINVRPGAIVKEREVKMLLEYSHSPNSDLTVNLKM
jgi:hypothetical protein